MDASDESSDDNLHMANDQDTHYTSKRQKVDKESALFQAYRALGYYTSAVPLCVYRS